MLKRFKVATLLSLAALALSSGASAQTNLAAKANSFQPQPASTVIESDRVKDGFVGPVRRVRTETVKLSSEGGSLIEGKRALLEVVAYDVRGNKVENQYFPVTGATPTGKENYKYDDKGNISEMTLLNDNGELAGKEIYKYEFDFLGNWNKMTTAVAVVDAGKITFEPAEVTYRSIMYYLDENMVKMVQPAPAASVSAAVKVKAAAERPSQPAITSPTVAKPNVSDKRLLPALPTSDVTTDKLNAVNSGEFKPVVGDTKVLTVVLDSEPPPVPEPKPVLKPVSSGVLNGTALSLPAPAYPENARRMRVSGLVSISVIVDETGKVISAEAVSGPVTLRDAALQAASRARFSPTMLSGQPVKVSGVINYKFSLTQ
jgi:TonB family protein